MFFRLIPGKNYALLFMAVVGITILSAYLVGEKISAILFFLSFYYIGILQIQSDAILNRSWTAKSKKETDPVIFSIVICLPFIAGTAGLAMSFWFPS